MQRRLTKDVRFATKRGVRRPCTGVGNLSVSRATRPSLGVAAASCPLQAKARAEEAQQEVLAAARRAADERVDAERQRLEARLVQVQAEVDRLQASMLVCGSPADAVSRYCVVHSTHRIFESTIMSCAASCCAEDVRRRPCG